MAFLDDDVSQCASQTVLHGWQIKLKIFVPYIFTSTVDCFCQLDVVFLDSTLLPPLSHCLSTIRRFCKYIENDCTAWMFLSCVQLFKTYSEFIKS